MMDKPRTIAVDQSTKDKMDKVKVVESETYDSVITRLLRLQKVKVLDAKKQKRLTN